MVREEIKGLIRQAIKELQKGGKLPKFEIEQIRIEHPENKLYGDYSANVAFEIAKKVKKKPMEIAKLLNFQLSIFLNAFKRTPGGATFQFLEKIEAVEPGFINFFLSEEFLQKQVKEILEQKENFGELKIFKNKKANAEFISANPVGPLHIGNGRGAFFGDVLANVLEKAGYKITREYFINDAKKSNQICELGRTALGRGDVYLTSDLKLKIKKLKPKLKRIKNEGQAGHLLAQEVQKDIENFIEKKLKIKFDNYISEQKFYNSSKVKKIYQLLKKKNLIYKKQGAEWLKTSKFGDKRDWVVVRANGEPSYLLSDIAYHKDRFDKGYQKIINIWGADHQGHISKIKAGAKILGYKGDLDVLITQIVRLKGKKKLSKRKGEIITLEELINEVGLDVVRFFYLTKSLNSQMAFDLDLAKEQSEKNPVYYIQYAYARIHSILRKLKAQSSKLKTTTQNLKPLNHPSELNLIKQLIKFPEVVGDTARDYQVHRVPQYAFDLAVVFHQFYRDCQVLTEDKDLREARFGLILATKFVLKNTLDLMGISAPEKM